MSRLTHLDGAGPTIRRRRSTTSRAERHYIWCLRSEEGCEDMEDGGKVGGKQREDGNLAADWAARSWLGMVEMSMKTPTIDRRMLRSVLQSNFLCTT